MMPIFNKTVIKLTWVLTEKELNERVSEIVWFFCSNL